MESEIIKNQEKTTLINHPGRKFPLSSTKYYIFCLAIISNSLYNCLIHFPQSLESYLLAFPYNFSSFEYSVFYGISSFPNIFLPLFVGIYTDKKGYSWILIFLLAFQAISGMIIIMYGAYNPSFLVMIIGRLMLGLGMENLAMIMKKMVIQISKKAESVAFWGIFLSSNRLGTILSSYIPTLIYTYTHSITYCFFIAVILTIVCCIFVLFGLILIKKTHIDKENGSYSEKDTEKSICTLLLEFCKEAPVIFWMSYAVCCLNFMIYYGFFSSENDYLINAGAMNSIKASFFIVIFCAISLLGQPIIGYVFSRLGYYILTLLLGALINEAAFLMFLSFYGAEDAEMFLIPLSFFAIGYALCSTFAHSVAGFIVHSKNYGLAYGLLQNCHNFGGLFGALAFGLIKDQTTEDNGYFWPIVEMLVFETSVGVLGIAIFIANRLTTKSLCSKAQ